MGKNIKLLRGEGNVKSVGKNITWKKGKGKQYLLPFHIKAVGKYIKLGRKRGKGSEELGKKITRFSIKNIRWKRISNCRDLYTPLTSN